MADIVMAYIVMGTPEHTVSWYGRYTLVMTYIVTVIDHMVMADLVWRAGVGEVLPHLPDGRVHRV